MKSIIVVLPYFGKFPNYFSLFLKSCAVNPTINWLIATDQELSNFTIPDNVIVNKTSFHVLQQQCEEKYGIGPASPYSLCKYRVVYHELFYDYVRNYDFWGYCDCDLIWGDLRSFLTEEILNMYEKISWRGHLTLFRNDEDVNNAYKYESPGFKTFKGCINESDGVNLFDEVGINKIFKKIGYKIYEELPFADLQIRSRNFICQHNLFDRKTNINQIFRWSKDGLYRIYVYDNKVYKQSIAYVHFLKRPMKLEDSSLENDEAYLIIPNKFIKDEELTARKIYKYSRKTFYWSYYLRRLTLGFLFNKIKGKFNTKNLEPDVYERQK